MSTQAVRAVGLGFLLLTGSVWADPQKAPVVEMEEVVVVAEAVKPEAPVKPDASKLVRSSDEVLEALTLQLAGTNN